MPIYTPDRSEVPSISKVIARAFMEYPLFRHSIPDSAGRQQKLEVLFHVIARYAFMRGNVLATSSRLEGVLLHLSWSRRGISKWDMIRSGAARIYRHIGPQFIKAQQVIDAGVDELHATVAPADHEYLWVLAVDPPFQGTKHGRALLEHLLGTLNERKRPCYLETMDPRNVEIYKKFGFEVAGTRNFEEAGFTATGMLYMP